MNLYELIKKHNFQGFSIHLIRRYVLLVKSSDKNILICLIGLHFLFYIVSTFYDSNV